MAGLEEYLKDRMSKGTIHITLLDPDKLKDKESTEALARKLKDAGTDAFLVGGSTGVTSENLEEAVLNVKEATGLPAIYFPSGVNNGKVAFTDKVDGMFYMSVVNSNDPNYITHIHAKVAPYVRMLGIECIPMAYIIVEPGMTVGKVTKADLIKRDDYDLAMGYAIAAEDLGYRLIYLEAGSGADRPVPAEMIESVKDAVKIPVIVGGGIRTPEAAAAARMAGADAVVTGTFVEQESDAKAIEAVVHAAKGIE